MAAPQTSKITCQGTKQKYEASDTLAANLSCSLYSFKGGYIGDYIGDFSGARSVDYGPSTAGKCPQYLRLMQGAWYVQLTLKVEKHRPSNYSGAGLSKKQEAG